jgi:hydroxymethylbilane synthase
MPIRTGLRGSPLSLAQLREMQKHLDLDPVIIDTQGDGDRSTSLRELDKSDFFTREIDEALLNGRVRLALHSAKDLPEPLPEGLTLAALTPSIAPHDVLVGEMRPGMRVATSSKRREESVRRLIPDAVLVDVRGNIGERLAQLEAGKFDGLVVAEAALIRLGLTHLERTEVPGDAAPLQGQLALVCRTDDFEMRLHVAHIGRRVLNLGLSPRPDMHHYPVIRTEMRPLPPLRPYTHLLLTSKTARRLLPTELLEGKTVLQLGELGKPTAEGLVEALEEVDLENASILYPHSTLSRPVVANYLKQRGVPFQDVVLYDTHSNRPGEPVDLDEFDALLFTSPSCVRGFLEIYGEIPKKELIALGPTTLKALQEVGTTDRLEVLI